MLQRLTNFCQHLSGGGCHLFGTLPGEPWTHSEDDFRRLEIQAASVPPFGLLPQAFDAPMDRPPAHRVSRPPGARREALARRGNTHRADYRGYDRLAAFGNDPAPGWSLHRLDRSARGGYGDPVDVLARASCGHRARRSEHAGDRSRLRQGLDTKRGRRHSRSPRRTGSWSRFENEPDFDDVLADRSGLRSCEFLSDRVTRGDCRYDRHITTRTSTALAHVTALRTTY